MMDRRLSSRHKGYIHRDHPAFCGPRVTGGVPCPGSWVSNRVRGSGGGKEDDVRLDFWCRAGGRA